MTEISRLTEDSTSDERQAFLTQQSLFEQTRRVYVRDSPFICPAETNLDTPSQQTTLRKANRATFISALLVSHEISLHELDDRFLDTFIPPGQRLLKWQGAIYLELKTQAYIFALLNSDPHIDTLLDDLFPTNIEDLIISRHTETPNLVASEHDFVERLGARKQYLLAEWAGNAAQTLPAKYPWEEFVREFAASVYKNLDFLLNTPVRQMDQIFDFADQTSIAPAQQDR